MSFINENSLLNDSMGDFESFFDKIKAKTTEELRKFKEENVRQTEEIKLFKNKVKHLEESNRNLSVLVVKHKNESEELKKKLEERNKTFDSEVENKIKNYEQSLNNEIKRNEALSKQIHRLSNELDVEKKKNPEFVDLQSVNKQLKKEVNQLNIDLNNEKKSNAEVINGLNIKCNDLSKKLESQIKANRKLTEDYKSSALRMKTNFMKAKQELDKKLNIEINKNRESAGSQQVINYLKARLDLQIANNAKQSQEYKSALMKKSSEINSLKRQNLYYKNCNEINKRKHLKTQYVNFKDNELNSLNVAKIHASIRALNKILEEFEQKNTEEREMIRTGANIVVENRPDERVCCPMQSCAKALANSGTWMKHMKQCHGIKFDL